MHALAIQNQAILLRRQDDRSGGGGLFVLILIVGIVVFLVLRSFKDREEQLGANHRPMGNAPLEGVSFACPYPKCPACGAAGDKMRHQWDGMRKITWNCGYCGAVAGVQELKDEELPASARQRLGLDVPQGQPMYPPQQSGMGGVGGLLTGMMIGEMLGGHRDRGDGWGGGAGGDGSTGGDWGDGGGSDSGGGDWGDSGGGDSGGGDF
jgi:hypothetical protein